MTKKFKIDNSFYKEDLIQAGLNIFKEDFNLEYENGFLNLLEENEEELIYLEFMNYLIYLKISDDRL